MIITKIDIRIKGKPRLKAVVSIHIEDKYILNDLKLINCNNGRLRVEFPKVDQNRFFFCPTTNEARQEIEEKVIEAYQQKINELEKAEVTTPNRCAF